MNNHWDFDQDNTNKVMNTDSSIDTRIDMFGDQPAKQTPRKVKLELTTHLESISTTLVILSIIGTIFTLLSSHGARKSLINATTASALAVSILLIIVRMNIDEYYVLDTSRQALMLRSKMFSRDKYSIFAPFKKIDAVVANGKYNSGGKNRPNYWTYRAEIVLNTGKVIPIDNWTREGLCEANKKASNFAKLANVTYVPGGNHACATPIRRGNKYTFQVKVRTLMDGLKAALPFIIVFVALALGMVMFK